MDDFFKIVAAPAIGAIARTGRSKKC